jgi:hypothetical protein
VMFLCRICGFVFLFGQRLNAHSRQRTIVLGGVFPAFVVLGLPIRHVKARYTASLWLPV